MNDASQHYYRQVLAQLLMDDIIWDKCHHHLQEFQTPRAFAAWFDKALRLHNTNILEVLNEQVIMCGTCALLIASSINRSMLPMQGLYAEPENQRPFDHQLNLVHTFAASAVMHHHCASKYILKGQGTFVAFFMFLGGESRFKQVGSGAIELYYKVMCRMSIHLVRNHRLFAENRILVPMTHSILKFLASESKNPFYAIANFENHNLLDIPAEQRMSLGAYDFLTTLLLMCIYFCSKQSDWPLIKLNWIHPWMRKLKKMKNMANSQRRFHLRRLLTVTSGSRRALKHSIREEVRRIIGVISG